jgi:outer membrane lipoprotein carrier protein
MRSGACSAFFAFFLACPLPAGAAKAAGKPAKAAEPADERERFLYRSSETLTVAAVLEHFELFDRELRSLTARFTQTVSMGPAAMTSTVQGTLAYQKPERLRVEHQTPEPQTIVSDGKDLWIHRPSQSQVLQSALKDWRQADPAIDNLLQIGNYAALLRAYDVTLASAKPTALTLRPKAKGADPFELKLTLSEDTLFPSESELSVGEARIRTQFETVRYNPVVPQTRFKFTPPPGADVFRNYKPPRFTP